MIYALLWLWISYYGQGEETFKNEGFKWKVSCWWETTIPLWKAASRKDKRQVAQVGFHSNLTLDMVFLWQNYFIEPEDFSSPFCLSFKLHAGIIAFILPKSMSLEKKN